MLLHPFIRSIRITRLAIIMFTASHLDHSDAFGDEPAAGKQVEQSLKVSETLTIPYLLFLPDGYDESSEREWPVILFLHGRGESRGPLSLVAKWGPPRFAARGDDLPYIVIAPQCPNETNWIDPEQQNGILALLDHTLTELQCDRTRVYLTGLSMGGYGSWRLAADHPEKFAAVVPICGKGDPTDASKLVDLPIWVFHGDKDSSVPFQHSVDMVNAIREAGGNKIRFTTLEEVGHNCWSAAYATPELFKWLDEQTTTQE